MDNNLESSLLKKLLNHYTLNQEDAYDLLSKIIKGTYDDYSVSSILTILAYKGETASELLGFAKALSNGMKKFNTTKTNLIDIVGTGGDKKSTFNISTVSCLVLSCLGVGIAKEIKPCVSSKCGSLDLLKALNINIAASFEAKKECLDKENFVFLSIPEYYPNLTRLFELEAKLDIRTIISLLPPLCHPAMLKKIIIGTTSRQKASLIYDVVKNFDLEKAYILWNDEAYDELVPIGTTRILVYEKDNDKREVSLTANDFSLSGNYKPETLIPGGNIKDNLKVIESINNLEPGIVLDTVIMNVSLGLKLVNLVDNLKDGTDLCREILKNNNLINKINNISSISNFL